MTELQIQDAMLKHLMGSCSIIVMNYFFHGARESDIFAVYKSGYKYNYEIKTTLSDFKADFKKHIHWYLGNDDQRWAREQPFNRWAFVVTESLLPKVKKLVPFYSGLLVARPHEDDPTRIGHISVEILPPLIHKIKITDRQRARANIAMLWRYYRSIEKAAALERKIGAEADLLKAAIAIRDVIDDSGGWIDRGDWLSDLEDAINKVQGLCELCGKGAREQGKDQCINCIDKQRKSEGWL